MDFLRTPDSAFDGITGFDHPWDRAKVGDGEGNNASMAWTEGGPGDADPVVLLHGEPTWSYLYRDVMGPLVAAGHRVVAPDLMGFGRSDKPTQVADHTYARHLAWLSSLLWDHLGLSRVTLVGQDWGGLLGLRLAVERPADIARIVVANTGLPTGDHAMPDVWWAMREAMQSAEDLDIGRAVAAGCRRRLTAAEQDAYRAPFPDDTFKAGPRALPGLVPVTPQDPQTEANRAAWRELSRWERPVAVAFSDSDPITGPMADVFAAVVPGTRGCVYPRLPGGHFLQEDAGPTLAAHILDFIERSPG